MTRSGQAGAKARTIASTISCEQWLVESVTGAPGSAQTTVPGLARTVTGRSEPSFLGISGSKRKASAIATADCMLACEELTKLVTWGLESPRSTSRPVPRFVTVARIAMSSLPRPSSSSSASPE